MITLYNTLRENSQTRRKFSKVLGMSTKSLAPKTNILVTNAGYQDPFKRTLVIDDRDLVDIPKTLLIFRRVYEFHFSVPLEGSLFLMKNTLASKILFEN